jgi:hypothetical protein
VDCISAVYGQTMLNHLFKLQHKQVDFGKDDWAQGAAMAFMLQHAMPGS